MSTLPDPLGTLRPEMGHSFSYNEKHAEIGKWNNVLMTSQKEDRKFV